MHKFFVVFCVCFVCVTKTHSAHSPDLRRLQAGNRRLSSSLRPLIRPQELRQDQQAGSQTQTFSHQGDCSAKCAGPSCTKGASESGPGGIPVCNDGSRCTELVYGCELCDAPIIEVQAHSKLQRDCELYYGLRNVTL